jgi:hypothetical protein
MKGIVIVGLSAILEPKLAAAAQTIVNGDKQDREGDVPAGNVREPASYVVV